MRVGRVLNKRRELFIQSEAFCFLPEACGLAVDKSFDIPSQSLTQPLIGKSRYFVAKPVMVENIDVPFSRPAFPAVPAFVCSFINPHNVTLSSLSIVYWIPNSILNKWPYPYSHRKNAINNAINTNVIIFRSGFSFQDKKYTTARTAPATNSITRIFILYLSVLLRLPFSAFAFQLY
jgi:hypothetical protein